MKTPSIRTAEAGTLAGRYGAVLHPDTQNKSSRQTEFVPQILMLNADLRQKREMATSVY
jgi:hypothetical protein